MTTLTLATALALLQQAAGAQAEAQVMSGGGWLFMSGAWVCILSLVVFTFSKVLRGGRR